MLRKISGILLLMLLPLLIGKAHCRCQRKEYSKCLCFTYNRGVIMELFLLTVFYKIGTVFQWGTNKYIYIFVLCVMTGILWGAIVVLRNRGQNTKCASWDMQSKGLLFIIFLLIFFQMQGYIFIDRFAPNDGSVEMVNTMLANESFFDINPFTGGKSISGEAAVLYSPLILLYGSLCKISGLHPSLLIRMVVPFWVLLIFASICMEYGEILFQNRKKALMLVMTTQILSLFGAEKEWLVFNFLLFKAWTQEGVLYIVLLPLLILQCFYVIKKKNLREWLWLGLQVLLVAWFSDAGIFYLVILGVAFILVLIGRKVYDSIRVN